jgi:catechol 2,3-dioxygenase-like lactoylglutathione lyase family enzyme
VSEPGPAPAPELTGVLESVLYYPPGKHAEMAAFYEEVMGFRSIGRSPDHFLFYRAGGSVFLLFNHEAAGGQDSPPPHGARGAGHVCFVVPDQAYGTWKRHLEGWGVVIEDELEWPRGGRSFYFRDPAGNALEIADRDVWPG